MLVLSRKLGEEIVIGNDVVVTVLDARGDNVKLGVKAPRHVSVHRREIYDEILKANQQAVSSGADQALSQASQWLSRQQGAAQGPKPRP